MNVQGWFKYVKKTSERDGEIGSVETYENISEKIAECIAIKLDLPCAKIELGTYHGETGCLSYNILGKNKVMSEGISYIVLNYKNYDSEKERDLDSGKYYCLEMVLQSLNSNELKNHFLKVMIFDFIIGNSDRHSNNWAIIKNSISESFAPVYDNGSSLCSFIKESQIDGYLRSNDAMRFFSLVDTKSRTLVRIDGSKKSIPTHKAVLQYLHDNYYDETNEFVNKALIELNEQGIDDVLRQVIKYISNKRYELIRKYLREKMKILREIYRREG